MNEQAYFFLLFDESIDLITMVNAESYYHHICTKFASNRKAQPTPPWVIVNFAPQPKHPKKANAEAGRRRLQGVCYNSSFFLMHISGTTIVT